MTRITEKRLCELLAVPAPPARHFNRSVAEMIHGPEFHDIAADLADARKRIAELEADNARLENLAEGYRDEKLRYLIAEAGVIDMEPKP